MTFAGGAIVNSGTITGSAAAIDASSASSAVTIVQTGGTISGAIKLSSHGDALNISGGSILGDIVGQGGSGTVSFALGAGGFTYGSGFGITGVDAINVASGTVVLDGSNSATTTAISGGSLQVGDAANPGAVLTSAVTVAGGTLSGHGTIGGALVNNAGVVAPGGSIGTLHVSGSYAQGASGTLQVEVSPTAASQLAVSGAATLGGSLRLAYDAGTYSAGAKYTVLTASSLSGQFATVSSTGAPYTTIDQTVSYTGTEADVTINSVTQSLGGAGAVFGAASTALFGTALAGNDVVFGHLDDLQVGAGVDETRTALAGTAPLKLAFSGGDLSQLGAKLPDLGRYGVWVRGIGSFFSARAQGAAPGFQSNAGGVLTGLDRPWGEHARIGAAIGYSRSQLSQDDGTHGSIDTPRMLLYATYAPAPRVLLDGVAGLAYDRIHTTRPVAAAGGNAEEGHNGWQETLALRAGYAIPWAGWTVIPRAGLQYLHLDEARFAESGAGGFDLSSSGSHVDSLQPVLSVSALKPFTTEGGTAVVPELRLSYARELLSTNRTLTLTTAAGSLLPAQAVSPAKNTLALGPAITVRAARALDLYADYTLTLGLGRSTDHTVEAGLRWTF